MAYTPHRSDLISAHFGPLGGLTLRRIISGQTWTRQVGLDDYLTPMEAAVVLDVHRVTMYDWLANDLLPKYQGPDGILLLWRDVQQFGRAKGLLA